MGFNPLDTGLSNKRNVGMGPTQSMDPFINGYVPYSLIAVTRLLFGTCFFRIESFSKLVMYIVVIVPYHTWSGML